MKALKPDPGEALERISVPGCPPARRSIVANWLVPMNALVVRISVAFLPSWRPKFDRQMTPAACCTVIEALPRPLEIARKLIVLVAPMALAPPMLVMSWAEPRSLVMRTSSAVAGGNVPLQLPEVFQ